MKLLHHLSRIHTAAALVGVILFSGCSEKKSPSGNGPKREATVPVDVQPARVLKVDRTLPIVGTLFAKDEATVAAEVEGKVERTLVDFGDRLKEDQEIALIDTALYEKLAAQASANVARARAMASNAEKDLARLRELAAVASKSDLDKATAASEQVIAEVKAAEAAEEIAKLNLARSRVRAPFDAAVAERIASVGDFVKVGTPLFRVVNDGVLKYIVQAPERYAGQVEKQQLVTFSVDAFPSQTFTGRVYLISPQVNTTTRAFAFGALVQNPDRKLRANTFARGHVVLEREVPITVVPLDAVVNFVGINKVFIVQNGVAKAREVQVGRVIGDQQEILSGIEAGETVVVTGQTKLYDGAKVQVKNAKPVATASNT